MSMGSCLRRGARIQAQYNPKWDELEINRIINRIRQIVDILCHMAILVSPTPKPKKKAKQTAP